MEQKGLVLKIHFKSGQQVREFMKLTKGQIKLERFGRQGVLGVYSRNLAYPENLENFLVIIQGHMATNVILASLAKEIKQKYPEVQTEVVQINF